MGIPLESMASSEISVGMFLGSLCAAPYSNGFPSVMSLRYVKFFVCMYFSVVEKLVST
jgi:hypothetical protein